MGRRRRNVDKRFAVAERRNRGRHCRCSGVAIGYNLCLGLFGGTTPLVATYLVTRTADDYAPAYYLIVAALVSFIALLGMTETARKPLS